MTFEVVEIECSGIPNERILGRGHYEILIRRFAVLGIKLPTWKRLKSRNRDQLIIITQNCSIVYYLADDTKIIYRIGPGFLTDLASIPGVIRSIIDNDQLELYLRVIPHDIEFGAHLLSFKDSNRLLEAALKCSNINGHKEKILGCVKRKSVYLGVSSYLGKRAYYDKSRNPKKEANFVSRWINKEFEIIQRGN